MIPPRELSRVRVLVSAGVVLECFTDFNGKLEDAEDLLQIVRLQKIEAYVTDYCLNKIGFFLGKPNPYLGQEAVSKLRAMLDNRVIYITHEFVEEACKFPIKNFDAAIEVACATAMNLSAIVTQHPEDFDGANLLRLTVEDFIKRQSLEGLLTNLAQPSILEGSFLDVKKIENSLTNECKFQFDQFGINSRNSLPTRNLQNANLRGANLSSAILRGADLRKADLQDSVLTFASLSFAKLGGSNLKGADLRGANLSLAALNESDLSFADLSGSNLSCTDLSGSCLHETLLRGANLQGADLQGADLQGADLQAANLKDAQLQETNVVLTKFGQNRGISEALKVELIHKGAIFLEERLGTRFISINS